MHVHGNAQLMHELGVKETDAHGRLLPCVTKSYNVTPTANISTEIYADTRKWTSLSTLPFRQK